MPTPHEILGLSSSSNEEQIRQRYLELVRQFPPDREPERFAEIRGAYETLKDPIELMRNRILGLQDVGLIDDIAADFQRRHLQDAKIPLRTLLSVAENLKS